MIATVHGDCFDYMMIDPVLGELAFRPSRGAARHRSPLASAGIQAVLALEVPNGQSRTAEERARNPQADSPHVTRESKLGRPADPVRARIVGSHGVGSNCA